MTGGSRNQIFLETLNRDDARTRQDVGWFAGAVDWQAPDFALVEICGWSVDR